MLRFINKILYILGLIIESSLILRLLLKFVNANSSVPFVHGVYRFTNLWLNPFFGLAGESVAFGYVIDWLAIVGMLIYLFIIFVTIEILSSL